MNDKATQVRVHVNGQPTDVAEGVPLLALLDGLGIHPAGIMVERNGEALLRSEWPEVRIAADDRFEVLRVVAGG